MPKSTNWFMRKYAVQNNKPKNLCQIYRIQITQHQASQQNKSVNFEYQDPINKTIRIDKNPTKYQIPKWAQVNQREEFGYAIAPESPILFFNDHEQNIFDTDQPQNRSKYHSWEHVDTNQDWIEY